MEQSREYPPPPFFQKSEVQRNSAAPGEFRRKRLLPFHPKLVAPQFRGDLVRLAFGQLAPGVSQTIGRLEIAQVNLPVGVLIWLMIIPMLMKVDFGAVGQVRQHWRGIGVTLFVNWAVKPFSMAFLGWLFIRQVFAPWLPAGQLDSYVGVYPQLRCHLGSRHPRSGIQ